jgi:hypothetical protein
MAAAHIGGPDSADDGCRSRRPLATDEYPVAGLSPSRKLRRRLNNDRLLTYSLQQASRAGERQPDEQPIQRLTRYEQNRRGRNPETEAVEAWDRYSVSTFALSIPSPLALTVSPALGQSLPFVENGPRSQVLRQRHTTEA